MAFGIEPNIKIKNSLAAGRQEIPMNKFSKAKIFLIAILFFGFFGLAGISEAATLQVGSGQTYLTIGAAITASSGGDTINIHAGTYHEHGLIPKSGSAGAYSVIRNNPGDSPIIDAQLGSAGDNPIFILNGDYIKIYGLKITGGDGGEHGAIDVGDDDYGSFTSSYIIVDNNIIYDNNLGCVSVDTSNSNNIKLGHGSHITISNNEIYGNCTRGIIATTNTQGSGGVSYVDITNNYIHNTTEGVNIKWADTSYDPHFTIQYNRIQNMDGIHGSSKALGIDQDYVLIQHNILDSGSGNGIVVGDNWFGNYMTVRHNTIYGFSRWLYTGGGSRGGNNAFSDNIVYNTANMENYGTGNVFSNFTSDPLFVNYASRNFTPQAGSGAIGTASDGTNYGADVSLVGPNAGQSGDITPPTAPSGLSVQ